MDEHAKNEILDALNVLARHALLNEGFVPEGEVRDLRTQLAVTVEYARAATLEIKVLKSVNVEALDRLQKAGDPEVPALVKRQFRAGDATHNVLAQGKDKMN